MNWPEKALSSRNFRESPESSFGSKLMTETLFLVAASLWL